MKIKFEILLVLSIVLMMSINTYATSEVINLVSKEELFNIYHDTNRGSCVVGDTLYILGTKYLFIYQKGNSDPVAIEYALPILKDTEFREVATIFRNGNKLCGLVDVQNASDGYNSIRTEIIEIYINEGAVQFSDPLEINLDELFTNYPEDGYECHLMPIDDTVGTEDYLYLCLNNDMGDEVVYCFNINSAVGSFVDVENVVGITPWDNKSLLIETYDYAAKIVQFIVYNPEVECIIPACDPVEMPDSLYGIAYSIESDRLFYLNCDQVMAVTHFDFVNAKPVAELMTTRFDNVSGKLLPGDYYVYSTYEKVSIRNTTNEASHKNELVIQGALDSDVEAKTYSSFMNSHSNVTLTRHETIEEGTLIKSMMNRDSTVDIYILDVNCKDYEAVFTRGYMAELDNETLLNAITKMYPSVQNAILHDGTLVALPVNVYGWIPGFNYEAFDRIGVEREYVPDNWIDFLDLLSVLPELLPEDDSIRVFNGTYTQKGIREALIYAILNSWRWYTESMVEDIRYDSPVLNTLIEKVFDLDLTALGIPEVVGEEYGDSITLVEMEVGCTIGNFFPYVDPTPLSIIKGVPGDVPLQLSVAFVNPFSKNTDLAQEYLAFLYTNLGEQILYNLCDGFNTPVRNWTYKENNSTLQKLLEDAQTSLANADPIDKPRWEETITEYEQYIADNEENNWEISPKEIIWYRSHGDALIVERFNYLEDTYDIIGQLLDGRMNVKTFLKEIDRQTYLNEVEGF